MGKSQSVAQKDQFDRFKDKYAAQINFLPCKKLKYPP